MSRVEIAAASLRDLTYVGANLRDHDAREVLCQVPDGFSGSRAAAMMWEAVPEGWAWVANLDGNPACAFGFQPFTAPVWVGWALGTKAMLRTVPAVTRHCLAQEDRLLDLGVRRVEVRTIKGHDLSVRWLTHLGCGFVCDLPDHGRDGEAFQLWAWALGDGRPSQRQDYRNVHSKSTQAPDAAAAA